jgi:hypothetical protein
VDEDVDEDFEKPRIEKWITLVHVCRRWRSVIFQSPRRLKLRLLCTSKTRARDIDIWPPLPLIIRGVGHIFDIESSSMDNIKAALEHNDHVSQIKLGFLTGSQLEYVMDSVAMRRPFPELTDLRLHRREYDGPRPILPDSFLGGTTPRLRSLVFWGISFPGLPNLLSSATHLVNLSLYNIPRSGYFPPEAMATGLSALTSLKFLRLHFRYPQPRPTVHSQHPRPPAPLTRSILPSLTNFRFKGASEYLEEVLARINAPQLNELHITFFNQIIFETPQLFQLISRTPTLMEPRKGRIACNSDDIIVKFSSQTSDSDDGVLAVRIPGTASEWLLSSLEQVCASSLPLISTLEDLYILEDPNRRSHWPCDVETTLWPDLLRSFVAVKNLYLSKEYVPRIAPALQGVLPTLENIFLGGFQPPGPLHEGIRKFVAARKLTTSHPVVVSRWDTDSNQETRMYWDFYDR